MRGIMTTLLAAVLGLAMVTPVLAQDDPSTTPPTNEEIVEQCLADLRGLLEETRDELAEETRATVETVTDLGAQGAPKPAIVEASRSGIVQTSQTAVEARQEIRATGAECIQILRENDAPRQAVKLVKRATKHADRLVKLGARNSRVIIKVTTRQALKGTGEAPVVTEQDVISDAEIARVETGGKKS